MALRATFYRIRWIDRNGVEHHGRLLGNESEIKRALKETGMTFVSSERITNREEIRELSFRALAELQEQPALIQRTINRRQAVKKARAKAQRQAIKDAYDSLGMKRVRGAHGGIYWE